MTAKQITYLLLICVFVVVTVTGCRAKQTSVIETKAAIAVTDPAHWTHRTLIAGHGLNMSNISATIEKVQETHVFGIETDNDITGRYESWLDPTEKLAAIEEMAKQAHAIGNYAFVYIAGMECITKDADASEHSFYKDHPDWVQRDREGNPAIFSDKDAFWIVAGDEDVWISPFAPEWRARWMEHIRAIAATGIDGLWLDIPYWMTHFDGWTDSWASFDQYTVAEFKQRTGLNAFTDFELGNYSDPNFLKWVDFRLDAITEFIAEARMNIRSANQNCLLIPEVYPGLGADAVIVGADVYRLYEVSDAIAHEYSEGAYMAASREPIDWFTYMAGMLTFRSFAQGKATWMLSYSWDGETEIVPADAMENLFMSQIMSGTHPYDARTHVMSGSNDYSARARIYEWITRHEQTFFQPREPMSPVGIYFSPKTRDYFADEYLPAFNGMMYLLMQSHLEFEIVTPRTLADFAGSILILPEARIVGPAELSLLNALSANDCKIMTTGETGLYNAQRQRLDEDVFTGVLASIFMPETPGTEYYRTAHKYFDPAAQTDQWGDHICVDKLNDFRQFIADGSQYNGLVRVTANPAVATHIAEVNGQAHVFIANYTGLISESSSNQIPQRDIEILFRDGEAGDTIYYLPFLGDKVILEANLHASGLQVNLPPVTRGAVVWLEKKI